MLITERKCKAKRKMRRPRRNRAIRPVSADQAHSGLTTKPLTTCLRNWQGLTCPLADEMARPAAMRKETSPACGKRRRKIERLNSWKSRKPSVLQFT
jgi:transposase